MSKKPMVYWLGPDDYGWAVDHETYTSFFTSWREAYDWALRCQLNEPCRCGLGTARQCWTEIWGCGPNAEEPT